MTRRRKNNHTPKKIVKPNPPPPKTVSTPNPPGFLSNMMSTIAQGFAFGTGSSIAHKTIDSIFSSTNSKDESSLPPNIYPTDRPTDNFNDCVKYWEDYSKCIKEDHQELSLLLKKRLDECSNNNILYT